METKIYVKEALSKKGTVYRYASIVGHAGEICRIFDQVTIANLIMAGCPFIKLGELEVCE